MYGEIPLTNLTIVSWLLGREAGVNLTSDKPAPAEQPDYASQYGTPTPPPAPSAPQTDIVRWTPEQREAADRAAWRTWRQTAIPQPTPPPAPLWTPPKLDSMTIAAAAVAAVAAVVLWRTTR